MAQRTATGTVATPTSHRCADGSNPKDARTSNPADGKRIDDSCLHQIERERYPAKKIANTVLEQTPHRSKQCNAGDHADRRGHIHQTRSGLPAGSSGEPAAPHKIAPTRLRDFRSSIFPNRSAMRIPAMNNAKNGWYTARIAKRNPSSQVRQMQRPQNRDGRKHHERTQKFIEHGPQRRIVTSGSRLRHIGGKRENSSKPLHCRA